MSNHPKHLVFKGTFHNFLS